MKGSEDAIERWRGQMEELKMYPSYKESVGIDGEATEFDWEYFPTIFVIADSSRDPKRLGEKDQHSTRRVQGPDHLHVNVQ